MFDSTVVTAIKKRVVVNRFNKKQQTLILLDTNAA